MLAKASTSSWCCNNGGGMNGTTNEDRTTYFEELPKNQLDLGLFLEADRMRALNITQANLDNQRNAVQEERRQGIDNQPYGRAQLDVDNLSYDNFAYKHSTIGSMSDLNAANIDDVKDFFRIYYAPNNAVLTLVGDFDPDEALAQGEEIFWRDSVAAHAAERGFDGRAALRRAPRNDLRSAGALAADRHRLSRSRRQHAGELRRASNWRSFWARAKARGSISTW